MEASIPLVCCQTRRGVEASVQPLAKLLRRSGRKGENKHSIETKGVLRSSETSEDGFIPR